MKSFKSFICKKKKPGAGFEGTNELRKTYIANTPGQVDPLQNPMWGWPTPHLEESQRFSSAATSINKSKLPKGYTAVTKHFGWTPGTVHLDIGGGRFDNAVEHLKDAHEVRGHVYDPFNRSEEHNADVLAQTGNGQSDTVSLFNVLNVIEEPEHHLEALRLAHSALKPDGKLYVGVYEGDRSGVGKQTGKDAYQRNEKLSAYLPTIQSIFPNASVHKGIIHATKEVGGLLEKVENWDLQKMSDDEGNEYSVKDAIDYAKRKGPWTEIPIESTDALKWWHKKYSMDDPDHVERMKTSDTSYPVLAIEYAKGKYSIADGLNRVKKAHSLEGKTTVPAYIMHQNELKNINQGRQGRVDNT